MNKTVFNASLWGLTTFNEIGYDKKAKKLSIFLYNGYILEFKHVQEKDIFEFILAENKEYLVHHLFKKKFPYEKKRVLSIQL